MANFNGLGLHLGNISRLSDAETRSISPENAALPLEALEAHVLEIATRVATIPPDIQQINKRALHRQMEAMGIRNGIRAGTELQALSMQTASRQAWADNIKAKGLTAALSERDAAFGDYRTGDPSRAGR